MLMQELLSLLFITGALAFRDDHMSTALMEMDSAAPFGALERCSVDRGIVPDACGGMHLKGDQMGQPVGCGNYGVAVTFQDTASKVVVAKLVQTPIEAGEMAEEKARSLNECAIMKFLKTQGATHVLQCEATCDGQVQMTGSDLSVSPVIITAPFVENAKEFQELVGLASQGKIKTAVDQTLKTGAYMLAAGVVNADLDKSDNVLYAEADGTANFIDLGLAQIIHSNSAQKTWEELGLQKFGFVTSEMPFRVPLNKAHGAMRRHIDGVLLKVESVLDSAAIEDGWRRAWEEASSCAYKVEGLREAANEMLHGLLLLRAIGCTDVCNDEADVPAVRRALEAGKAHTGPIWNGFKQEALDKAAAAVDLSKEGFDNLKGYEEVVASLTKGT